MKSQAFIFLVVGATILASVMFLSMPTWGKDAQTEFAQKGIGCWRRDDGSRRQELCFRSGGRVDGMTAQGDEGFGENGLFHASRSEVQVLGFPGNGWPSTEPLASCRYSFDAAGRTLSLSDCNLAGDWRSKTP